MLALFEIMEDDFSVLLETFTENSEIKIKALNSAVKTSDSAETKEILHFLKDSCLSVGTVYLASLVTSFEALANQAKTAEIEP